MATKGAYGIRKNGEDKLQFVGYDAYPSGLGETVVRFIEMSDGIPELSMLFDKWECVRSTDRIEDLTVKQFKKNKRDDLNQSQFGHLDMEDFIGDFQGAPHKYLDNEKITLFICNNEFLNNPSCEWGYIINIDTEMLEVWKGGQTKPQSGNRYGEEVVVSSYYDFYPSVLIKEIPISTIMDFKYKMEEDKELLDMEF